MNSSNNFSNDLFWIYNPAILFSNLDLLPSPNMSHSERLNSLTRLLLLITSIMYFMGYDEYFTVLMLGLLLIIILKSIQDDNENFTPRRGNHDPCHTCGFDSQLPYINTKYETSPIDQYNHTNDGLRSYTHAHFNVKPLDTPAPFRQIWRNESRWCNEYTQYPNTYNIIPQTYGSPLADDYMTKTFSQPSNKCNFDNQFWIDNTPSNNCDNRKFSVSPAIQSAFMRDSLNFRNNVMGDYIDQIQSQRNYKCQSFKPGRKTF